MAEKKKSYCGFVLNKPEFRAMITLSVVVAAAESIIRAVRERAGSPTPHERARTTGTRVRKWKIYQPFVLVHVLLVVVLIIVLVVLVVFYTREHTHPPTHTLTHTHKHTMYTCYKSRWMRHAGGEGLKKEKEKYRAAFWKETACAVCVRNRECFLLLQFCPWRVFFVLFSTLYSLLWCEREALFIMYTPPFIPLPRCFRYRRRRSYTG